MLPQFPNFKKIELSDKETIEKFTNQYPVYSDFNFTSMWSWNIKGEMELSLLNNNLIVKFTDYINGNYFLSFLGENNTTDTTLTLLNFSKEKSFEPILKLVPETSIKELNHDKIIIEEDRDHFDYILDLKMLSDYDHSLLRDHASFKRRIIDEHGSCLSVRVLDVSDKNEQENILVLTKIWAKNKVIENKDFLPSLHDVMEKYFTQQDYINVISVGIFYKDTLIAFTINELLKNDFSVCHFMKADNSYKGIYSYLVSETSKCLINNGIKYINFEQDLGLKNLRQAKKTYNPIDFLKKYKISLR